MAKTLSLFPILSKKKAREIFRIPLPVLSYSRNGVQYELTLNEPDDSVTSISDENGFWNPDDFDLELNWKISYEHGSLLYGAINWEYACACHDANIGIALSWYSKDSKRRTSIPFGTINNNEDITHLEVSTHFDKAELRGIIGFSLILYLQSAGNPYDDESYFANSEGIILGEIANIEICLDGNGSFFTIYDVSRPGEPLWEVEYNIDDPCTDQFSDCVSICFNRAHKNYPLIEKRGSLFCQPLFIEILSNSIATVIETVRAYEKDDGFDCLNSYDEGSVAQALAYFKNVLQWDFTSPITVLKSARIYIEKHIKSYENT